MPGSPPSPTRRSLEAPGSTPSTNASSTRNRASSSSRRGQFMIGIGHVRADVARVRHRRAEARVPAGSLAGDAVWCQLFSEPGAGSDVASLQTEASRDGDEWVVNGQKVWTSGAHYGDYGLLRRPHRPDVPEAPRHHHVHRRHARAGHRRRARCVRSTGDAHFNEVFLDDVRLPADALVGERRRRLAGRGRHARQRAAWPSVPVAAASRWAATRTCALARRWPAARRRTDDPVVRQELADLYCRERILALPGPCGSAPRSSPGGSAGPEGSVAEAGHRHARASAAPMSAMALGRRRWLRRGTRPMPDGGAQATTVLFAPHAAASPAAPARSSATSSASAVLGLPKEPAVDRDLPFRELRVGTQKQLSASPDGSRRGGSARRKGREVRRALLRVRTATPSVKSGRRAGSWTSLAGFGLRLLDAAVPVGCHLGLDRLHRQRRAVGRRRRARRPARRGAARRPGTTRFTSPMTRASSAVTARPESSRSIALPTPTSRGSIHDAPNSATSPRRVKAVAIFARAPRSARRRRAPGSVRSPRTHR